MVEPNATLRPLPSSKPNLHQGFQPLATGVNFSSLRLVGPIVKNNGFGRTFWTTIQTDRLPPGGATVAAPFSARRSLSAPAAIGSGALPQPTNAEASACQSGES